MKRRGFTLVELLVVISIIALLMAVLMPALGRARAMAYRVVCGTHLSGIGKSMLIYAADNDEEYPRAGGRKAWWSPDGRLTAWDNLKEGVAFRNRGNGGPATITSSFWLMVKWADVTPKQFVCKGDAGAKIFKLGDEKTNALDFTEVWDFGTEPGMYCSYSYHMPYYYGNNQGYPVTVASRVENALCADRSPYLDKNVDYLGNVDSEGNPLPDWRESDAGVGDWHYFDELPYSGGAAAHQREGQNVLFNDSHVKFEKFPNVGIENDNIYQAWPQDHQRGDPDPLQQIKELGGYTPQAPGDGAPMSPKDSYLVNEVQPGFS